MPRLPDRALRAKLRVPRPTWTLAPSADCSTRDWGQHIQRGSLPVVLDKEHNDDSKLRGETRVTRVLDSVPASQQWPTLWQSTIYGKVWRKCA